ncbi:hypothetical protein [Shinella sp. G-2]|uniref:hypothetical protein n=1 Tax=Shinella sp. G-2 TaxID=3133141 RepID=UPI003CFFF299
MPRKQTENPKEAEALAFAQKAIEAGVDGHHAEAVKHWQAASDYADSHLSGADIDHWIKSGLGAALYDSGAYREAIAVSMKALDWCASHKHPLPAITLARSYRRLGDHAAAQTYLDQARFLAGDPNLEIWEED